MCRSSRRADLPTESFNDFLRVSYTEWRHPWALGANVANPTKAHAPLNARGRGRRPDPDQRGHARSTRTSRINEDIRVSSSGHLSLFELRKVRDFGQVVRYRAGFARCPWTRHRGNSGLGIRCSGPGMSCFYHSQTLSAPTFPETFPWGPLPPESESTADTSNLTKHL